MKRDRIQLRPINASPEVRSNSSGNLLAKRLYRNNSLTKLTRLGNSPSILGSLNTSLIPSISLRKLNKFDYSQPSIEISQGKIFLKKHEQLPFMTQQASLMKKKGAHKKFQKIDSIAEKNIVPQELKAEYSSLDASQQPTKKWKPSRKWLTKLKQGSEKPEEKLTPQDFIQLIQEQGGLGNQFCYLQKGSHPYDLKIVDFGGAIGDEYITISARGVTYFNWQGSRFVTLEEWRREAYLFEKLMSLEFFGKYRLHKNYSNWKKYYRKVAMKKTTDKLKSQLLVHDRHLRQALLQTRGLCCRLQSEINYCYLDDSIPPLPFNKFKTAQENFLNQRFQKKIGEVEEEIKCQVATCLGVSMREFKQQNKISSTKQGKGLPLLIGDQKNLQMPYTKEATLRVQQQKFKRFLKLVELLVVHSKINMMDNATSSTSRKLQEQNDGYEEYILAKQQKPAKVSHFKGKQYIQCNLQIQQYNQKVVLKPSREDLTTLMEDIVNRSIVKLVRNHHRIINDPDINAILYEGIQEQPKEPEPTNILKAILGTQEKQESMVEILNKAINRSYNYLEKFMLNLSPLVVQLFRNQNQLIKITQLNSRDFFTIKEWIEVWRKELQDINRLSQEHESAVFILNFKNIKQMTIQSANLCLSKIKQMVPKILQQTLRKEQSELSDALKLMEVAPIGIDLYIDFQNNKNAITSKFDDYDETLSDIGQLIDIMKDLGGSGQNMVIRSQKERKELSEMLKALRARIEQSQMHNKVHESYAQEEVRKMIPKVFTTLEALYRKTKQPRLQASPMMRKIEEMEYQYANINLQLKKLRQYQKFLGMGELAQQTVQKFAIYFKAFKDIWLYKYQAQRYQQEFLGSCWKTLSLEYVKITLDKLLQKAELIKKSILKQSSEQIYQIQYTDENMINLVVLDIKKKIKPVLEAIQCLRDSSLQEKELKTIKNQFENKNKRKLSELTSENDASITSLLKQGLIQELDFLIKIVFKSKKQLQLNSKMAAVNRFWGDSGVHSSKGLIDNFAQHYWTIAAEIDEKITVINCVRQDPEVQQGQFRLRVQNQKNLFDSLRLLLTEWQKHHNFLSYFQPIFANPYWKGTSQYKAYTYAETNWKKLTKQITKDFSLRKLASQEKKHFAILKQNNTIFQQLKHSVQLFLNAKRQAFPKLYFISNEQLLHLLLQDKDYASIDKHLSRIFSNLKSLELNQDRNSPLAVRNMVNQVLSLRLSPPKQVLELQQGLKVIQERIKQALKFALLKCSNYYLNDDFNRRLWIKENILQVLLFIGNSQFTKLLEYDYLTTDGEDLNQLLSYQTTQIKQLHNMLKQEYEVKIQRNYKLGVLLMQAGHFRDIILKLIQNNVHDDNSYEWQRQVRSYYNGSQVAYTKYLTRNVDYGYQFVCPNYSYTISTLSEKYFIQLINTISLQYLPILNDKTQLISNFCISNAKNYFSVTLQPKISSSFLHNLCHGALASNTFLQIKESQQINEKTASLISSFIFQSKCILERRQAFHMITGGKSASLPTFSIALRMGNNGQIRAISQKIKINYRVITVAQIPISVYLCCVCSLAFHSKENDLGLKLQKVCEIINKCSGYDILNFEEMRSIILQSISADLEQLRKNIYVGIITEINNKVCQQEQIKFFQKIVRQILLQQKQQQSSKYKNKAQKDGRNMMNIVEILSKKQCCIVVGPIYNGKKHFLMQSYTASGVGPVEIYYTDFITYEKFLGCFENDLWKEGILPQHLKQVSYSQQQWFVFEGQMCAITQYLIKSISRGFLLLQNGEVLYISSNWKFIVSTDIILNDKEIPKSFQVIYSESFSVPEEQLQYQLQTIIRPYFKSNVQGFLVFKNTSVNYFEKILKFRLKGRFLKTDHLINNFIKLLECLISKSPQKILEIKESQIGLQKMLLWSIYWTFYPSLSIQNAKKFESQFFEQVKIESDRSLSLSLSKFQLDNPSGSFKRIQAVSVTIDNNPYHVTAQREAIFKFIEQYLVKNRNVLLIGQKNAGKSQYLTYIKENLGEQNYSFLSIKMNQHMNFQKLQQLLYRKAKVIVSQSKQRLLSAINGKQLIILLDDVNLLDQQTSVGRFFKSILTLGHFYDHVTHEKVHINNVSIIAAQNSTFQFNLSYDFVKNFQPICLPELNIRDLVQKYSSLLKADFSEQICHNVASLHQFAFNCMQNFDIIYPMNLQIPLRILKTLRYYNGKQNLVRVWQYVSLKEYTVSFPQNESFLSKITAQIKNYSNLVLKNNQQPINVVQNRQSLFESLIKTHPYVETEKAYQEYYEYILLKLQLIKPINVFTINQPICPSLKIKILQVLCTQNEIELIHPYLSHQIMTKNFTNSKVAVFLSNLDQNFEEILQFFMAQIKSNMLYIIDFENAQAWQKCVNKYPSLMHYGSRYIKHSKNFKIFATQGNKQLSKYCDMFAQKSKIISRYQSQQIRRLMDKHLSKIEAKCTKQLKNLQQLVCRFQEIKKQSALMQKELESHRTQLQKWSKQQQRYRRQLLQLKNNYEGNYSEKQKNAKNLKIQQIESKLNEIMASKRSGQDQSRVKQDQCSSQNKILNTMVIIFDKISTLFQDFQGILKNKKKVACFLAIVQYYFLKQDASAILAINLISKQLPIPFEKLTKCLYQFEAGIQEQTTVIWLFNEKSIVIQDQSERFTSQIAKKQEKCHVITTANELQDITNFQPNTVYMIVGQIKSQAAFFSDMNNQANDKDYRQRNRVKEDVKDVKQEKYIKQLMEDKPDYKKNLYFIIKENQNQQKKQQKKQFQNLYSNISIQSREGREDFLHHGRVERKVTQQVTIRPTINLVPPFAQIVPKRQQNNLKKRNFSSKATSNLKQQITLKIKRRQNKQGQNYSKTDNQLQDFLIFHLENKQFNSGGKKIVSVFDKNHNLIPNVTLICRKPLTKTQREEIKTYRAISIDEQVNFINDLLEQSDPFLTASLKNEEQQLQKLRSKKQLHYTIILQKLRQNTPRSLNEIGKKDGDFMYYLTENIKSMQEKVDNSARMRSEPYLQYFQLSLSLWRYLKKIAQIYPTLRVNKRVYKKMVMQNIKYIEVQQRDGQQIEPEFKIDTKVSKDQLINQVIKYILTSFSYQKGLFSCCLLAIRLQEYKNTLTQQIYSNKFYDLLKGKEILLNTIQNVLQNQQSFYEIIKFFQLFTKNFGEFNQHCHNYIKQNLNINFEIDYYLFKQQWVSLAQNFTVICEEGANGFESLSNQKKSLFITQYSDFAKSSETIADKNCNKLVLINFTKEECYSKILPIVNQSSEQIKYFVVLLFTDRDFYQKCQFKQKITQQRIIEIQRRNSPNLQLQAVLRRNFKETGSLQIQKILKIVLLNQIQLYFKKKIEAKRQGIHDENACFYQSDFAHILVTQLQVKEAKTLLDILSETVYLGRQKFLIKQSRKFLKKQDGDLLYKTYLGESPNYNEDYQFQQQNFVALQFSQLVDKIRTVATCQEVVKMIMPSEYKESIDKELLYGYMREKKLNQCENIKKQIRWQAVQNFSFESFKNLQTIKLKRESDIYKYQIRRENSKAYLIYRWLEHKLRALKQTNDQNLLSQGTRKLLLQISYQQPLFGFPQDICTVLTNLQRKITHLQSKYLSNSLFKRINLDLWEDPYRIIYLYLYSSAKKGNLGSMQVQCRVFNEKEEKKQRGWIFETLELKNCKLDVAKNMLQINDRNQNKKLNHVVIVLQEKEQLTGLVYSLPLLWRGKEYFKLDLQCKFKDDGNPWREKIVGIIKVQQS